MINILELFRLAGRIDLTGTDKANQELDNLDKKGKGLGSKLGSAAKKVGKAGAIVGGAMAGLGTAAFAMAEKVTGSFDDISKGAQRTGVSSDFYQEMDFWASQNGLSHERMEKAVGRFNQRLGQGLNGNEKYANALNEMGINLDDVRDGTLSTEDAFAQSISTLSSLESEQDKINLATEMFGTRMARDMLPALQDGALGIDEARQKAQELGLVIGEDSLDSAVKFQDTWDSLKRSMTTASQQILAQLMPAFQGMMDWILENMPQIQAFIQKAFDVIGTVFNTAINWVQSLISWFREWFSSNEETMTGIWTTIQTVFTQVVDFLQSAWETIKAFWEENGQAILTNAQNTFNAIWETIKTVFNAVKSVIEQVIGYVVPWVQEKLEVLRKFWDENGEQIMSAVQNAFEFIRGVIEFVMPIIQGIIKGAWKVIQSVFDTVIGVIMGLVKTFSSLLTGDFEGIREGVTSIWESLWDGIKGIVSGAWGMLAGALSGLWSNFSGWFSGLKDDALQWGKNMIQGFIDGIFSMGSKVANAASNVVSRAADFIKFWSPAKKGEGRYITHWGRNMIDGFLDGVRDEEDSAGKAMNNVIAKMQPREFNIGSAPMRATQTINSQQSDNTNLLSVLQQQNDILMQILNKKFELNADGQKLTDLVNEKNAVSDIGVFFE